MFRLFFFFGIQVPLLDEGTDTPMHLVCVCAACVPCKGLNVYDGGYEWRMFSNTKPPRGLKTLLCFVFPAQTASSIHTTASKTSWLSWTLKKTDKHVLRHREILLSFSPRPMRPFPENDHSNVESKHASKSHENSVGVLTAAYGEVTNSSQVKSIWQGFTAFLTVELISV